MPQFIFNQQRKLILRSSVEKNGLSEWGHPFERWWKYQNKSSESGSALRKACWRASGFSVVCNYSMAVTCQTGFMN